ncbi:MAG: Txe/YoeB family addiction module toxin [Turneriella sp.]|nr:Txe/YoeB family addiction module toxin [Turneriella sp.]
MNIHFTEAAWQDYVSWQTEDKKTLKKINDLSKDIKRSPFDGIGKPEPLKHQLQGYWSRRIDLEHRLVYQIDNNKNLVIIACRYHY